MSKKQKAQARNAWVTFARRNELPTVVSGPDIVEDLSEDGIAAPVKRDDKPWFPDPYPLEDGMTPEESIAQWEASVQPEEFTTTMSKPVCKRKSYEQSYEEEQASMNTALTKGVNTTPAPGNGSNPFSCRVLAMPYEPKVPSHSGRLDHDLLFLRACVARPVIKE